MEEKKSVVNKAEPCLFPGIGLVILASGLGKRFGSNKLLAEFAGKPMIQRVLDASEGLFEKRIVVTRHIEVEELCSPQGIPVLFHTLPGKNDTIRLGVEKMEDMKTCIFATGDQPLLTRDTLIRLGQAAGENPALFYRCAWKNRCGSPAAFPNWSFPLLKSLPKGKGGNQILRQYADQVRYIRVSHAWELEDADTKEKLEELQKIWKILYSAREEDVPLN